MADHPDLAALLGAIADEDVPTALGQLVVRFLRTAAQRPEAPVAEIEPYTLAEAARLLRKSTPWTRRAAKRGRIPGARKVGRSWVFDRGPFDRWRSRPEVG